MSWQNSTSESAGGYIESQLGELRSALKEGRLSGADYTAAKKGVLTALVTGGKLSSYDKLRTCKALAASGLMDAEDYRQAKGLVLGRLVRVGEENKVGDLTTPDGPTRTPFGTFQTPNTDPHIIWREIEVAPRTAPLQAAPSQHSPEPRRLSKELLERRSPVPAKSRKTPLGLRDVHAPTVPHQRHLPPLRHDHSGADAVDAAPSGADAEDDSHINGLPPTNDSDTDPSFNFRPARAPLLPEQQLRSHQPAEGTPSLRPANRLTILPPENTLQQARATEPTPTGGRAALRGATESQKLLMAEARHKGKSQRGREIAEARREVLQKDPERWWSRWAGRAVNGGLAPRAHLRRMLRGGDNAALPFLDMNMEDVEPTLMDRFLYRAEKVISGTHSNQVLFLSVFVMLLVLAFGVAWHGATSQECDCQAGAEGCGCLYPSTLNDFDSFWTAWSFMISAQYLEVGPFGGQRLLITVFVLSGLTILAIVISIITESFAYMVTELNTGRTKVIEKNHVVILGWNSSTPSVVAYLAALRGQYYAEVSGWRKVLCMAVQPRKLKRWWLTGHKHFRVFSAKVVVVCSTVPKEEMVLEIRKMFAQKRVDQHSNKIGRDIICRIGEETSLYTMFCVNTQQAHRVVVMLNENDQALASQSLCYRDMTDSYTLQALLALQYMSVCVATSTRARSDDMMHIVAQLTTASPYIEAANWCKPMGQHDELAVSMLDVGAKLNSLIMACALQPGLGLALETMLSMEGSDLKLLCVKNLAEFYNIQLAGLDFLQATFSIQNHVILGIVRYDRKLGRRSVLMNPVQSEKVQEEDELLVMGDGDPEPIDPNILDLLKRSFAQADVGASLSQPIRPPVPKILVCGWRHEWNEPENFGYRLREFKALGGSELQLGFLNTMPEEDGINQVGWKTLLAEAAECAGLGIKDSLVVRIEHFVGRVNNRKTLERIDAARYNTFVVLSSELFDNGQAVDVNIRDSRVLSAVMALSEFIVATVSEATAMLEFDPDNKDLANFLTSNEAVNFVSELSIEQNRDLANLFSARANGSFSDFVNAVDLVAMLVAQICYRPILDCVWTELLRSEGSEVHCVFATLYVSVDEGAVPFWQVMNRVRHMRKSKGDICLGYITTEFANGWGRAKCMLAPSINVEHTYLTSDKLVILALDCPVSDILQKKSRRENSRAVGSNL